ncbi:MAG TPA: ATP-binding protein [Bacteroidia bacterium]|nr:ATP-binding protein [Bacteroidia bacterium]
MEKALLNKLPKAKQYLYGIFSVIIVAAICYFLSAYLGYKIVALVLLFTVSVLAMFLDIFPVLVVALLSALIWDFFFIPPTFNLLISNTEDGLMFLMYFIIAMVNAALNYKTRQWEKIARKREEKRNTLSLYNTLLNSLSHELRTPISTIIGATDNLKADKAKLQEEDKDVLVSEISKAALRLNGHVENLLNMSRLESGVVKPIRDWCDINELAYDVKHKLKEYSANHNIKINVQENLPLFKIDAGLITQSIYNLVYNALIYTPANGTITITAFKQDKNLVITVEDTGNGFPENEKENVFEKFYRLKNSRTGGTGLGLSIVKGFVGAHYGTILLENVKTGGAKFTIIIPAEASATNSLKNE